jgi:hypothetical protein
MINHDQILPEPVEFVSAQTLRDLFNSRDYTNLAVTGQLRICVKSENHLLTPEAKQLPRCTLGQFIEYLDSDGQWHAQAYQYLKPDGSLGASGKPDPKRIRDGGKILALYRV